MSRNDEAYLELDDAPPSGEAEAAPDPTPGLTVVGDDESFLEVTDDSSGARAARGRVVSEDDLRMVGALADDGVPLLAALWPSTFDLLAELPTVDALRDRVALARTTLNQVTRRGAEWRARAEVAGSALTRRLDELRRRTGSRATSVDEQVHSAACNDLRAWHHRALEERVCTEAAGQTRVYADGVRKLLDDARRRGVTEATLREISARVGVELLQGEVAPWTPCTVLPGAPRTLDAVAQALVTSQSQGVAALRDGSLVGWIRANRASEELVAIALEAQSLAQDVSTTGAALVGLWSLVWGLGRDGVLVDGHTVTGPETLLGHLRAARLHESGIVGVAPVLARWFRVKGHGGVALACEALARGEAHAELRLRWALGEPFRLGDRVVADPSSLAREVLSRQSTRAAALESWRNGTLRAWLETLPRAKRDALWLDDLSRALAHEHDEGAFWRGVYRRVPRAALRVYLGDGFEGRVLRFQTVADLHATARVAAVWEPLKQSLRSGELGAWLSVAAPGIDLDAIARDARDDVALHELLAALGHTGLVLPWGRSGYAISSPVDIVAAWKRAWQQVEAQLALGHVTAWLKRFHPSTGVAGVTIERAVAQWGASLGVGTAPSGVASLRLALLCGLDELPLEPQRPMVRGGVRGYRKVDALARDAQAWEPLWADASVHRAHGTALLWMARQIPLFGVLAAAALTDPARVGECTDALVAAGVPVATETLATERMVAERESARLAAEREAARLAAEREAAVLSAEREAARVAVERQEARVVTERESVRREVEREITRLTAERDAARMSLEREIARIAGERDLVRIEAERDIVRLTAERDEARIEAERAVARIAMERDEARLEARRVTAQSATERDAARIEAERARLERDIARLETEQVQRRAQRAKEAADQGEAERDAARLHEIERARKAAELETARLRALEEQARREAERESSRIELLEADARGDAEQKTAQLTALADDAKRMAAEEADRFKTLEEQARRETARRAEEAAEFAVKLADAARRRESAEQEAEELARRLLTEREAAREASWAARRVAAEREIARLAEAERKARELAQELTSDDAPEESATAQAIEALVEIEGALDEEPNQGDLAAMTDEAEALPERRELRVEALIESQTVDDEPTLARVRGAVDAWATRQPGHGDQGRPTVIEVTARPAFEAQVTTRMETRALTFVLPPWRDDDAVPVPPDATAPGASVDPWALELPEVEAWTTWRAELLLDTAPIRSLCKGCEHGRVACTECQGEGGRTCPACNGRVRIRCTRCAGGGEVAGAKGSERCPTCQGRREQPCTECTYGRVACARCRGKKTHSCVRCKGLGQIIERVAVVQTYEGVAATNVVRGSLPDALAGEVQARNAEPVPVVHIEAAEIDPYALAREIPHSALGEAVAQLLADEAARVRPGQRVTRQRLVVRRYPAWLVRCSFEGDDYTVWVHGARDLVHADESPLSRRIRSLVDRARTAVERGELEGAVESLATLQEIDEHDAATLTVAESLGDAVLALVRCGELFEARTVAAKARVLQWESVVSRLVEAERLLGERLQVRSPWALAEEARTAFERGRDERCADRLTQLATVEREHPEGRRLAAVLGLRFAGQALDLVGRGDLTGASTVIARARGVGFTECGAAMMGVATLVEARARAIERRVWLPYLAVAVLFLALLAWLTR